jgi:hypothetical protein
MAQTDSGTGGGFTASTGSSTDSSSSSKAADSNTAGPADAGSAGTPAPAGTTAPPASPTVPPVPAPDVKTETDPQGGKPNDSGKGDFMQAIEDNTKPKDGPELQFPDEPYTANNPRRDALVYDSLADENIQR